MFTDEEKFEMNANFEAGETIVNILTGEKYTVPGVKKKIELTAEQKKNYEELMNLLGGKRR